MRIIAITNQKGGCGKTTTAVNLAAALAMQGCRTLLVDLDPQAHATLGLGLAPERLQKTIYDALINPYIPLRDIVLPTMIPHLSLAPSNVLLCGAESQLSQMTHREFVLKQQLSSVQDAFDWCLLDCSPSLSVLTLNAVAAATDILIPVQTHYYAIEGLRQMLETVDIVRDRFNPQLHPARILLTMSEKRTLLCRDVQQQLREYFRDAVFRTVIHRNIRLAEAPSAGQSILTYDRHSTGAAEYIALASEIRTGHDVEQEPSQASFTEPASVESQTDLALMNRV
ncbi:MAG: ParA family protein [Sedimentisphaerales bacterium]|nr:ParA family protein [Sedimentisphaerales bacterium]